MQSYGTANLFFRGFMKKDTFTEEDVKTYVEALNFIATEAKFGDSPITIQYAIKIRNHFAILQNLKSKIEDHILEVKQVVNTKKVTK